MGRLSARGGPPAKLIRPRDSLLRPRLFLMHSYLSSAGSRDRRRPHSRARRDGPQRSPEPPGAFVEIDWTLRCHDLPCDIASAYCASDSITGAVQSTDTAASIEIITLPTGETAAFIVRLKYSRSRSRSAQTVHRGRSVHLGPLDLFSWREQARDQAPRERQAGLSGVPGGRANDSGLRSHQYD